MADEHKPQAGATGTLSTKTLYELSVCQVADRFTKLKKYLTCLTDNILFDVYYELYKKKKLCLLGAEFSDLDIFSKMLRVRNRRIHLFQLFQALMDHGTKIDNELAISYNVCCSRIRNKLNGQANIIDLGLRLGSFLSDAGWYAESTKVLLMCRDLCITESETAENWCRTLDCCHKLLRAQAAYCAFKDAKETHELALSTVEKLQYAGYEDCNHAALYAEFSVLFFMRSEYDQAYRWSLAALKELKPTLPPRITIDVLRQAAKSCVVKREFKKAGLLIRQAVYLSREVFDKNHPKFCDVLIDYGFHLLNFDSIVNSVSIYENALSIRKEIFGRTNLHVAIAHEDLAYALYVREYSSGRFTEAREHVERAIEIMEKLLPFEHLMLASAKRVKALILEEIALDNEQDNASTTNKELLLQSEYLHLSALRLAQTAFGERNVQTAKHYGNLGRLYQSMSRFQEAEEMHLKAISIKEELLGSDDYEVGLSIGHLASLYNFHMSRYRDAEKLYYRSIAINLKLFGKSYSGLEYDYRGLLHVYEKLQDYDKLLEYRDTLILWHDLRKQYNQSEHPPIDLNERPQLIEHVIKTFFSM
ncbi:amyloid protein-binding protein 2 [Microplitis mediator]|uniref:amyloid protein-binding protein 2 n=1 Tax=Microplitis mediator TaxID=375433 RepID=UPI00255536C2|nr:amyloid protein-binding protein 2 [Microplitis mediator]